MDAFLTSNGYSSNDEVVLIGHSFGGNLVYQLAEPGPLGGRADALVTIDPIDWELCGLGTGVGCIQSIVTKPAPIREDRVLNLIQRESIFIQGYEIQPAIREPIPGTDHIGIDGDSRVHTRIIEFIEGLGRSTPVRVSEHIDSAHADDLTEASVNQVVVEAVGFLRESTAAPLPMFRTVIADLPNNYLGEASNGVIVFDINADDAGWFIDPTPDNHSEFELDENGQFVAAPGSPAYGRYDLLTVALHEIGHLLGHNHSDAETDLMSPTLPLGTRRLPDFVIEEATSETAVESTVDANSDETVPLASFFEELDEAESIAGSTDADLPLFQVNNGEVESELFAVVDPAEERDSIIFDLFEQVFAEDLDWLLLDPLTTLADEKLLAVA